MKAIHLAPALIVSLALALSGRPVEAQHHGGGGGHGGSGGGHGGSGGGHGGGGHGGSGHGGGGYAVPRSGGGHVNYGGVAGARHPQGGTGYGHSYGGHYGGHYGGYYGRYYGGYYPYYGYGYGYGYSPYFSLSFGWPYYSNAYPYGSVNYYSYYPDYSLGYSAPPPDYGSAPPPEYSDDERQAPPPREASRAPDAGGPSGWLRLEVRPEDTSVYVDNAFRGTVREARGLRLPPGRHTIELVRPGYATEQREIEIVTGEKSDLLVEMQRPR